MRRSDYIEIDHQHLAYLNIIEKFHCVYCSYGNEMIAYAREITACTEQYFCPIKHAQKVLGSHARYNRFLSYAKRTTSMPSSSPLEDGILGEAYCQKLVISKPIFDEPGKNKEFAYLLVIVIALIFFLG